MTLASLAVLAGTASAAQPLYSPGNYGQCVATGFVPSPSTGVHGSLNGQSVVSSGQLTGAPNAYNQSNGNSQFAGMATCSSPRGNSGG